MLTNFASPLCYTGNKTRLLPLIDHVFILIKTIYTSMQECAIDNNIARDTVIQHCLNRVQNPKFSYFNIDID